MLCRDPRRLFVLTALAWAAFVAAARADDKPKGERYALLVGVRQYSEAKELRPLPYAENDVTELAQVLRDGGYQPDNVVLMTQAAGADQLRYLPLKARVLKELDLLLKNRGEDDTVLLAFAGHGVVLKDDPDSYFCPADAQLDDKDTLLSLTEVYRDLEKCKAATKVLLVDACRNDPLRDKSRAPARVDLDSVTRPPAPAKDGGVAAFFSCSRGQKAYEDDNSKHGAFFHFVIEGLKGEASGGKDDVSLLELGAYVQRQVTDFARSEYGADQKPEMSNASAQGAAALVQAPDYVKTYRRGIKLYDQKDYDKAEHEFTEAIRLNPRYALAFNYRGIAWYVKEKYDKAINDFDEAIRIDPKDAAVFSNRGSAWAAKGEYDKAIADYDEGIRLDPKDTRAFSLRGDARYFRRQYDQAIADYDEAIRLDPKSAVAFHDRGNAWAGKKEYDKAIADYDEAIRLDPKYAFAFYGRGLAWTNKGEDDRAIADYDEAIRLDPKYALAFYFRGLAWTNKREDDRAIADFDKVIRLDPKYAQAYRFRGLIWGSKKEYDKAIADFDEAIRLDPKYAAAFEGRGGIWIFKHEYDKAIDDCTEAIRLDPKSAQAYRTRGYAYTLNGDDDAGKGDFATADRLEAMK